MTVLTQKAFAELVGKSPQSLSRDVRTGKLPVNNQRRVDTDDAGVAEYLKKRRVKLPPASPASEPDKKRPGRKPSRPRALDEQSRADLEKRKLVADAQYRELKNAQMEGRLVAREAMIRGVWNPLETFLTRLLADGAKTIAARVYPIGKAGGGIEEAEVEARKQLSTLIKPLIRSIKRALKLSGEEVEA